MGPDRGDRAHRRDLIRGPAPVHYPIAWAAILAYASWPLHARIERLLRGRTGCSAFLMTILMVLVVMVPAVLVSAALVVELQSAFEAFRAWLPSGPASLARRFVTSPGSAAGGEWIESLVADGPDAAMGAGPHRPRRRARREHGGRPRAAGARRDPGPSDVVLPLPARPRAGAADPRRGQASGRRGRGHRGLHARRDRSRSDVRNALDRAHPGAAPDARRVDRRARLAGAARCDHRLLALTPIGPPLVYVPAAAWLLLQGRFVAGLVLLGWASWSSAWSTT